MRTSATDPSIAAGTLAGLLVIVAGIVGGLLARSGRRLRQPTEKQIGRVADPLAGIAARHLPVGMLNDDLADVTKAAAGIHAYVLDESGPLITRTVNPADIYPTEN